MTEYQTWETAALQRLRHRTMHISGCRLRVKYRLRTEFLKPSIGVRTSSGSGHESFQLAQWRLVPSSAVSMCSNVRVRKLDYSITSSARASSDGGIVNPSALATLTLMTSSNLVDCSTGRSAGLDPFRILSTKAANRRKKKTSLGP